MNERGALSHYNWEKAVNPMNYCQSNVNERKLNNEKKKLLF